MYKSGAEERNARGTRNTAIESSRRQNKADIKDNGSKDAELLRNRGRGGVVSVEKWD